MRIIGILLLFSFIACKTNKVSVTEEGILISPKEVNWEVKMFSVSGKVTYSNSYCGGARPSDEMLLEITSPKPSANTTFYVRQGIQNDPNKDIFWTFKTDENGSFNFTLPPGDYVIIESNRVDSSYYQQVIKNYGKASSSYSAADTNCLKLWLAGSLAQFTISSENIENINWDTHHSCWVDAPCIRYLGPYPP